METPKTTLNDLTMKIIDNSSLAVSSLVRCTTYAALKTVGATVDIIGTTALLVGETAGIALIYSSFESAKDGFWDKTKQFVFHTTTQNMPSYFSSFISNDPGMQLITGIGLAVVAAPAIFLASYKIKNLTNDISNRIY